MPRISTFYGIAIEMYFGDHAPPHFHARYSGDEATIVIATGDVLDGSLPSRALRLVRESLARGRAPGRSLPLEVVHLEPTEPMDVDLI